MEILIMMTTAVVFFCGIVVGSKLKKEEKIVPSVEEIKEVIPTTKEYKERKREEIQKQELQEEQERQKKELERLNKIAQNIEVFNGTSKGQRSVD